MTGRRGRVPSWSAWRDPGRLVGDMEIVTGVCHMAFFGDPDGNALMLHHRYAPRTPLA